MSESVFLIFWICMTVILTTSAVLFFVFCRKCGMFKDSERCRHLALWAHTPGEGKGIRHSEEQSGEESVFSKNRSFAGVQDDKEKQGTAIKE